MKKANFVCKLMAGLICILIGCQGDVGSKYPPPQNNTGGVGASGSGGFGSSNQGGSSSGSTASMSTTSTGGVDFMCPLTAYDVLCEMTDGQLVVTYCCEYMHPFHIDTCIGEEQCPAGGVTCVGVTLCNCGEERCFSSENGCQPIQ